MNTNRFPTNCTACGTRVAAGAGRVAGKTNGRWNVTCSAHAPRPAARFVRSDDECCDAVKDAAAVNGTDWRGRR